MFVCYIKRPKSFFDDLFSRSITGGYIGIPVVTRGYRRVTRGYRGLQGFTRGYKGLKGVAKDYRKRFSG